MPVWRNMWSDPLILFLLIGGGFFLAYTLVTRHGERIEVTRGMQASLATDYETMTGHRPDAAQQAKLVRDYVANEMLFREAIERGLHLTDKATKQRLIDRLRFMITGTPAEPTEEQLINHYSEHMDLYRSEPQMSFEHVYFTEPPADPAAALARLNRGERVAGDDFWMGRTFPNYGQSMIRGMFGQPFLDAIGKAPPGRWFGPVRSIRGVHFVKVTGTAPPGLIPYPDIREQVRQDYMTAQTGGAIDAEVSKLERKYDVAIDR
ncbi:peptidyl-prolyl cis-trans isomerase [Sphingomonas profundi]|uniref:peptidylprolyl isomerase n=1 Tax=Alterirhizorhabdus profundi TaxID=2681549 RepID=UPI0012E782EF|nr:peptidylprolyl isomerase [Sphingomonas profundi]